MIKSIVFDMGNVLLSWDPNYIVEHCVPDSEYRAVIVAALFNGPYWPMVDEGTIDEDTLFDTVSRQLPEGAHDDLRQCIRNYDRYMPQFPHVETMMEMLHAKDLSLYILSNAGIRFRACLEQQSFFPLLTGMLISAEDKLIKPDLRIYKLLCERFGLTPSETLFIDDTQANVDSAIKAGLNAIRYDGDPVALMAHIDTYLKA